MVSIGHPVSGKQHHNLSVQITASLSSFDTPTLWLSIRKRLSETARVVPQTQTASPNPPDTMQPDMQHSSTPPAVSKPQAQTQPLLTSEPSTLALATASSQAANVWLSSVLERSSAAARAVSCERCLSITHRARTRLSDAL